MVFTGFLGGPVICNDVLRTGLEVICTLPPLSLANETKLPHLGISTLGEITRFVKEEAQ